MQFAIRLKQLAARLRAMGATIYDKEMAMVVLSGVPAHCHNLVVVLDALGIDQKDFGLDYVRSRLLQVEQSSGLHSAGAAKVSQSAPASQKPR